MKTKQTEIEQIFVFNDTVLFRVKLTLCFSFSYLKLVVFQRLSEAFYWQLQGLKSHIQKVNWVLRTDAIAELFVLSH